MAAIGKSFAFHPTIFWALLMPHAVQVPVPVPQSEQPGRRDTCRQAFRGRRSSWRASLQCVGPNRFSSCENREEGEVETEGYGLNDSWREGDLLIGMEVGDGVGVLVWVKVKVNIRGGTEMKEEESGSIPSLIGSRRGDLGIFTIFTLTLTLTLTLSAADGAREGKTSTEADLDLAGRGSSSENPSFDELV
ncbi:hypothetical protein A1O1_06933 [Capronia coronata CBS 617.96]|uniref:Uncharacterized protein n=1 Tax=Capronia coronata CBS 617.96 TaxID=1182541 RepID=W9YM28_9EURO|nr:uncharacterized protein A1O1_06933 [Capronia coronata CBS 617.96]EXJ83314.1 hypothetical protein A1O1_06933 [Capronia coronata CBS 617.96]